DAIAPVDVRRVGERHLVAEHVRVDQQERTAVAHSDAPVRTRRALALSALQRCTASSALPAELMRAWLVDAGSTISSRREPWRPSITQGWRKASAAEGRVAHPVRNALAQISAIVRIFTGQFLDSMGGFGAGLAERAVELGALDELRGGAVCRFGSGFQP